MTSILSSHTLFLVQVVTENLSIYFTPSPDCPSKFEVLVSARYSFLIVRFADIWKQDSEFRVLQLFFLSLPI